MDIATAKPTREERARVPHHLIDVADPGERYDAARYQREARAALDAIEARGRPALLVGGTGLYVRAVLDGLDLASVPTDPDVRARLEELAARGGEAALRERLRGLDAAAEAAVPRGNVRRLVRYLEIAMLRGAVASARRRGEGIASRRIGLAPPIAAIDERIVRRVRAMVDAGVLDETRALVERGIDPRLPSMTAHGYVHWAAHLRGEISLDDAMDRTIRDTRAYARRQMTWFRADPRVEWVDPTERDPLPLVAEAA